MVIHLKKSYKYHETIEKKVTKIIKQSKKKILMIIQKMIEKKFCHFVFRNNRDNLWAQYDLIIQYFKENF